jgi:hypothetical protein
MIAIMGIVGAILFFGGIGSVGMQDVCQKAQDKPEVCKHFEQK